MKTTYPSTPAISIESLEPQLSASHPILRDLSHCSFLPRSKGSQHARWMQLYRNQPQASFRDLEKQAHLRFIKESVLDRSFQGSLKPQASPSASLGKGDMWTKGRSRWFRSGEQWTASYFLLEEKALHSPDFDGEGSVQQIQVLATRENQVQERGH